MVDDKLANTVMQSLSGYLVHKKNTLGLFEPWLEDLLGQVEAKLSPLFGGELVERFKDNPGDNDEVNSVRLRLIRAIADDPQFAKQLATTYGGQMANSVGRRKWRIPGAILAAVVVLGGTFLAGRITAPTNTAQAAPATVTSTVERTVTETKTPTSIAESSSSGAPSSSGSAVPAIPGDGSSLDAGSPVFLTDLPVPNDSWIFYRGDHDVQFTQYSSSMWQTLNSCNSDAQSYQQQFRLKKFSRIEVKAIGTDAEAATGLIVRFEVFVNNDAVNPVASVEVKPGATGELKADLPEDVFSLTLRISVAQKDTSNCQRGNAVWGSAYVVAAGS
jgi:hypothetical protein